MAFHGNAANLNVTTDVSAGNYGSGNAIPVINIDSSGRLNSINESSVTYSTLNANANVGTIGSYAFMQQSSGNTQYAPGDTLAGSSLRYSDATGRVHNTTPSGNWRCMGYDSGAALTNSGTVGGSAAGSGSLQGGNIQGDTSATVSVNPTSDLALSGGNVQGNANVNVTGNVQGGKTFSTVQATPRSTYGTDDTISGSGSGSVSLATDDLSVAGNVAVNVNLGSITVNTTVAYSSTLWLRYS